MNHINFLEKKTIDLRKIELNYVLILIVSGSILFFITLFGFIQQYRAKALKMNLETIRAQVSQLSNVSISASGATDNSADFSESLLNRIEWGRILNGLGNHTPRSIRLTSLSGGFKPEKMIKLSGESTHLQDIRQYQKTLETLDFFRKVMIVSSNTKTKEGDSTRLEFLIHCWLK